MSHYSEHVVDMLLAVSHVAVDRQAALPPGGPAGRGADREPRVVAADGGRADQNRVGQGPKTIDAVYVRVVGKHEPIRTGVVNVSVNGHRAAE
jgi:hypothetical protein